MALSRPRIPENQNVLFPVQKAAPQQRPQLPRRFRRQPIQIEVLQRLLQGQRRVLQQPLYLGLSPLLAFPRDHLQQILLIAQCLPLRPPRRVFIALPHRRQVQVLQMPDQRRAYIGGCAHGCTPICGQNWSKLARSTGATSTIVTGAMLSSLASTSPIDSAVIITSAFLSSSSRNASSTATSPASAASFSIFKYSRLHP